ncbi:aminoglycoside phosphotransferase family protein [Terricaulis sp.]|uniref:aminoglycoside phosphotransferase family protein n=1 Tax=Terricaulis sp. TaxID=2768686 RepID=UPI0037842113
MSRSEALERLLAETGFDGAVRTPLAGDASTRRYERLEKSGRRAMLMDAPKSAESAPCPPGATPAERRTMGWNAVARLAASRVEAFVAVANYLESLGLAPPEIYGADCAAGYAVIEDLGDDLYAQVIPKGEDEITLYQEAAKVLAHVHAAPQAPPRLEGKAGANWPLLDYDALALEVNADLFVEWLPRANPDVVIDDAARARWERVRDSLIVKALGFPRAFTIRDYHAENLLWLPERQGLKRVGLLDFQDAVRGWRGWDFSMLLHDARRDVSPAAHAAAVRTYLDATGGSEAEFERELAVLGAINTMRILGIFSRLTGRDGKMRYLEFMPRMWAHLGRTLKHPALAETRAFVESVARQRLEQAA